MKLQKIISFLGVFVLFAISVFGLATSPPGTRTIQPEIVSIETTGTNDAPALRYKPGHSVRFEYVAEAQPLNTLALIPGSNEDARIDKNYNSNRQANFQTFDKQKQGALIDKPPIDSFIGFGADTKARGKI